MDSHQEDHLRQSIPSTTKHVRPSKKLNAVASFYFFVWWQGLGFAERFELVVDLVECEFLFEFVMLLTSLRQLSCFSLQLQQQQQAKLSHENIPPVIVVRTRPFLASSSFSMSLIFLLKSFSFSSFPFTARSFCSSSFSDLKFFISILFTFLRV